jgi:hypothetical protein
MKLRISGARAMAVAAVVGLCVTAVGCGQHEGPGVITGRPLPEKLLEESSEQQRRTAGHLATEARAPAPDKQILFGDLHVHTTFSADAFMMSLPMMQGEGAHPLADACDFARYCSTLDFWGITDHAESTTPRRWREIKESIRHCNAVAGENTNPDVVAFLGWEWTQVGRTPEDHYGHKNVIFLETDEDKVPRRAIHSAGFTTRARLQPRSLVQRWAPVLLDWPNRQRYLNANTYQAEMLEVRDCPDGVDSRELPEDCREGAATPELLFKKLSEWGFETLIIPHGTTWGMYTPAGSTWDKQLTRVQHDPDMQKLMEVFSGHGNSEEYRPWRGVARDEDGREVCPEPQDGYEPCCWRAGEIVRVLCEDPASAVCEGRVAEARINALNAGSAFRQTLPGSQTAEWKNCGSCPDCFLPSMNYRPGSSVQYTLAITNFDDPEDPRRFHFGFIASSDNHRARPGTGYKEYNRLLNTEAFGPSNETWYQRVNRSESDPSATESTPFDRETSQLLPLQLVDFERQASFFMTGGLVAAHAAGRSRHEIWDAFQRREVYGTTGPRILLWFELLNGSQGPLSMGGKSLLAQNPKFRVRAAGAFKQKPGCPDVPAANLSPERLEHLCRGQCYNPGNERHPITRIEVVRIRPQRLKDEALAGLIEDPWLVLECPGDPSGCVVEFEDEQFITAGRETTYYVRAIQEPTPAINAGALRCKTNQEGNCIKVDPCYGDYRTSPGDDCLGLNEERAWSSPLYLNPAS